MIAAGTGQNRNNEPSCNPAGGDGRASPPSSSALVENNSNRRLDFTGMYHTCVVRKEELQTLLQYALPEYKQSESNPARKCVCGLTGQRHEPPTPTTTRPTVFIEAEAGAGKSTLLQQFRDALENADDENIISTTKESERNNPVVIQGKFEPRTAASEPFAALQEAVGELACYYMNNENGEKWAHGLHDELQMDCGIELLLVILPKLMPLFQFIEQSVDEKKNDVNYNNELDDTNEDNDAFGNFNSKEYRFERFRVAFRALIRYTCRQLWDSRTTTLVMILDDFHWVDPDSLQIIKSIMDDIQKPQNFFLVLATRPMEEYTNVADLYTTLSLAKARPASLGLPNAALQQPILPQVHITRPSRSKKAFGNDPSFSTTATSIVTRAASKASSISESPPNEYHGTQILELCRLSADDILVMLNNLFQAQNIKDGTNNKEDNDLPLIKLAKIVQVKTQGNSFDVIQFLRLLEQSGHLSYNDTTSEWDFDFSKISQIDPISHNVSRVVADNLEKGDKRRKSALMVAASFGVSQFDVSTIVHAVRVVDQNEDTGMIDSEDSYYEDVDYEDPCLVKQRVKDMSSHLSDAASEGFLEEVSPGQYRFAHDRIRESAYSLLPEGPQRKDVHLQVGRQLRCWMDTQSEFGLSQSGFSKESLLLHATKQLNAGADLISDQWELLDLADLNYQAAELAARKTAFFSAIEYLQMGLFHLGGEDCWSKNYDRTLQFSIALTRMQYSCGLLEECLQTSGLVILHGKTFADKDRIYKTKVLCLMQNSMLNEALDLVLDVLGLMGDPAPRKFVWARVIREFMKARNFLSGTTDQQLLNLPVQEEDALETQLDFLQYLAEIGFLTSRPEYLLYVSFRYITLIPEKGNYPRSFFATQLWACFYKTQMGNFTEAIHYGNLSNNLAERQRTNIPGFVARSYTLFYSYVHHWQKPIRESVTLNLGAFRELWSHGVVDTALIDASMMLQHLFAASESLERVTAICAKYFEAFVEYQQITNWHINATQYQAVHNLMGQSKNTTILTGKVMDAEACLRFWNENPNPAALYNFQFWSMVLQYHFGDFQSAKRHIKLMRKELFEDGPCAIVPLRPFYTGLVYLALFRETKKQKYLRRAIKATKILKSWANNGAVNCLYMYELLLAEEQSCQKGSETTIYLYDKAILSVSKLELCHHTALANELAGSYLVKQGQHNLATKYVTTAMDLYQKWGAFAIVEDIKIRFTNLLE